MSVTLAHIWRHPIKGVGAEHLEAIELTEQRPLPLDRAWAILEDGGEDTSGWRSCRNFLRGAKGPSLMAVSAKVTGATMRLEHPDLAPLILDLDDMDPNALFSWLKPVYPENRPPAARLETSPAEGMADAPFASVSILNLATLRALSQRAGRHLDMRRFRGNLWLEGLAVQEEFDLVGRTLKIGAATLDVVEPITRCRATEASPETGKRDTATLQILDDMWGHTDFGVYAKVTGSGPVSVSDKVEVL